MAKGIIKVENLVCPVCKTVIGYRPINEPASADCSECKVTYVYADKGRVPIANKPICKKPTGCGCPLHAED